MRLLVGGSDGPLREAASLEVRAALLDDEGRPLCEAPSAITLEILDEDDAVVQAAAGMTRLDEDAGTATSATGTTLTDSAKAWRVDEWRGALLQTLTGTGSGQIRRVLHNTATAITLDPLVGDAYVGPWAVTPDATTTYAIHRARYSGAYTVGASLEDTVLQAKVALATATGTAAKTAYASVEA